MTATMTSVSLQAVTASFVDQYLCNESCFLNEQQRCLNIKIVLLSSWYENVGMVTRANSLFASPKAADQPIGKLDIIGKGT